MRKLLLIFLLSLTFVSAQVVKTVSGGGNGGGSGGGASSTSQLSDFTVSIVTTSSTNDTVRLNVPSGLTRLRCGIVTSFVSGNYDVQGVGNWTTNATNQAWEYFDCTSQQIVIDTNFVPGGSGISSPTSNVTIGSTTATGFPAGTGTIPLASFTAGTTTNQWQSATDQRAFLSTIKLAAGSGISISHGLDGTETISSTGGGAGCSPVGSSGNILTSTGSGCTTSGNFNWSGSSILNSSSNVNGTALELNNTSSGGKDIVFINGGASNHAGWWFIRDSVALQNLFAINLSTGSPEVPPSIQYCFGSGPGDPTSTCDAGIARATAKIIVATDGSFDSNGQFKAAGFVSGGSIFTLSSNGCSATGLTGSSTFGYVTSGTTGTCAFTVTFGASTSATHGWVCRAYDQTTPADIINQVGDTSTTASFSGTTVSGDIVKFACLGIS